MKISKAIVLEGKKHFLGFNLDDYPPVLHFKLSPLSIELHEKAMFNGFLDIFFCMPNGVKKKRRHFITKRHLTNDTFECHILAGDMMERMLLGLYYELPEGSLLAVDLSSSFNYLGPVIALKDQNNPLNYLEWLRSLAPGDFELELLRALDALEPPSDKGSMETFKKWAFTHQTIRLATSNQIPNTYLDWVALAFYNEYDEIQQTIKTYK